MAKTHHQPYRPPPHKTKAFRVLSEGELQTLETICMLLCTYADICHAFSMSKSTLVRMRKDDPRVLRAMNKGYGRRRLKLREAMFKTAEKDHRMMIFLAKKMLGYSDFRSKVK